ncbi:MAG: phosphoglycolate phosphatase [Candidatus Neomarinimicrobiota bacterium]
MLNSNIKAILFDLDGTLIQSAGDIQTAVNLTLNHYGYAVIGYDRCVEFIGDGVEKLIRRAFTESAIKSTKSVPFTDQFIVTAVTKFKKYYTEHLTDTTRPYPEVAETLADLQNYILAVISNKPYQLSITILEKLDLARHFQFVLGGDSLPTRKPDPGPILFIMQKLNLDASQVLVVGDSENDIKAGQAAGVRVVAVTYGFRDPDILRQYAPDYQIAHFGDLLKIVS